MAVTALPHAATGRSPDLSIRQKCHALFTFPDHSSGHMKELSKHGDEIAQDLHLLPFSPARPNKPADTFRLIHFKQYNINSKNQVIIQIVYAFLILCL